LKLQVALSIASAAVADFFAPFPAAVVGQVLVHQIIEMLLVADPLAASARFEPLSPVMSIQAAGD
jgi:hypothetical protein